MREHPEPYCDVGFVSENGPHFMELPERLLPIAEAKGWRRVVFKRVGVSLAPRTEFEPAQRNDNRAGDTGED